MSDYNLLFIYTDQQRYDTLAAYGNTRIQMPNLNRLAEQSVVFDRAYCTQPVCTPSRAALLTGLWPHTSGVVNNNIPLPADARCLPEMLGGDVVRGHYGKWHLGDEIYPQHGFAEWRAVDDTYYPFYSAAAAGSVPPAPSPAGGRDIVRDRSSYHYWLVAQGVRPWDRNPALPPDDPRPLRNLTLVSCPILHAAPEKRQHFDANRFSREQITALPEHLCKPAYLAGESIEFLRKNRGNRFALYVNFFEPHHPNHSPRDGQYDPAEMTLPPNSDHVPDESVPLGAAKSRRSFMAHGFDGDPVAAEADRRAWMARYWGMCSLVDTHVGRILAALDDYGLADRTIIFFTTDHGEMLGAHGLFGKGVMYEPSIRIPMLMRLPGQRRVVRIAPPVSQIDVVPTLLDYLGESAGDHLPGRSLRGLIEDRDKPRDVMIEWNPAPGATGDKSEAVRTILTPDGWKLTLSTQGRHELRNLNDDPVERGNLLGREPGHPQATLLRDRIVAWAEQIGDPCPPPLTCPPPRPG